MYLPKWLQKFVVVMVTSVFLGGCSSAVSRLPSPSPTNTLALPTASSTFTPSPTATTPPSATPTLTAQEQFDQYIAIGQNAIDSAVSASKQNDVDSVRTALSDAQQMFGAALEIMPDSPDVVNWLSWIEIDDDEKYVYVLRIGDSCQVKIIEAIQNLSSNDPINYVTWDLSKDYSIEVNSEEEGFVTADRNIVYPFKLRIPSSAAPGKYSLLFETKAYCYCCEAERHCSAIFASDKQREDCIKMQHNVLGLRCRSSDVLVAQHKFTIFVIVFTQE